MKTELRYPFGLEFMRQNKAFMFFCPPDCLDADGRPVLEGRSVSHKPAGSAYQVCPYQDSRADTPMPVNVDSLRALLQHQDEVFAFIREVARHLRNWRIVGQGGGPIGDLYTLAYTCYKSPGIYFVRQVFGEQVDVPVVCSVASRFFHGLVNLLAILALEHDGDLAPVDLTPEAIYDYADEGRHLVGLSEACAASRATIVKYLAVIQQALRPDEETARYATGVLSAEGMDSVVRATRFTMSIEFLALIYEVARCRAWRQINRCDSARGNVHQPVVRYATTHCLVAKKLSLDEQPFGHLLFRRARRLSRALLIARSQTERLIESATEYLDTDVCDAEARRAGRARLKSDMQRLVERHRPLVDECVAEGAYVSADVDIFFGRWPE